MSYKESLNDFINSQNWVFAKTMADIPHWYCLKSKCDDKDSWNWFVRFMDMYGVEGTFCGQTYKYLYWGDIRFPNRICPAALRERCSKEPPSWFSSC